MLGCGGPVKQGKMYFEASQYDDAVNCFRQATQKKPKDAEARIWLAKACNKAAEVHYQEAVKAENIKLWKKAADEYKKTLSFVPSYQDAEARLKAVESADALEHYENGIKLQDSKNWDAALKEFEATLQLADNFKDTYKRIQEVKESAADEHYKAGVAFESDERWDAALKEYEKVESYIPNFKDVREHITLAHQSLASQFYNQGLAAQDAGDWQRALRLYEQVQSHVPNYEDVKERIKTVSFEIAKGYVAEGDEYIAQTDTKGRRAMGESAKRQYELAQRLYPGYPGINQKISEAANLIIIRVAIQPFKGSSKTASQITNGMITYLVKNASRRRIQVVERTQLNQIFKEMGIAGVDPTTAAKTGKIKGVNVLTYGEVLEYSLTPKTETEKKEETKFDPKRPEGKRRYKVPYNYYTETKDVYMKVSFRLINAETATIEATDTFEATASDKRSWREGKEKPRIKSDDELIADAVSKVVSRFSKEILTRYR